MEMERRGRRLCIYSDKVDLGETCRWEEIRSWRLWLGMATFGDPGTAVLIYGSCLHIIKSRIWGQ